MGKLVSGLHVETNLQYLPALDNMKKNTTLSTQTLLLVED